MLWKYLLGNGMMKIQKSKLLKIVLPLSVMIFLILNFMDYQSTKKSLEKEIDQETESMLKSFISEVELFTSRRTGDVRLMADYIPYIVDDEQEVVRFLKRQHDVMRYFSALGFITPDGKIIADDGLELEVKERKSFLNALNGKEGLSEVFPLAQNPDVNVTAIAVPVKDEKDKVIGVLSGLINLEEVIHDITNNFALPGAIYFLKGNEIVYSYSKKEDVEGNAFSHREYIDQIAKKEEGEITLNLPGHVLKYGKTESDWIIIADSIDNPKVDDFSTALYKMLLLALLIVLVGILLFYYIRSLQQQAQDHLKKDLLTDLPNRFQLEEDISKETFTMDGHGVYVIRLDRFTELVERFGYQQADELLVETSHLLTTFNKFGKTYRVDFEVFVCVLECNSENEAISKGQELVQWMDHGMNTETKAKFNVSASVGGIWAHPIVEEAHLFDSGYACQEASKAGGNRFKLYNAQMEADNKSYRRLVALVSTALEKQEFYMVYQPIYCIHQKRIVGFESLIRWNSPELGEVGPFHFVSILEEDYAIIETGRWIMHTVAQQAMKWRRAGYSDFTINVNVSVKQLHYENFLQDVEKMMDETGVDPSLLIFEVTESVMVDRVDTVVEILDQLNAMGFKTAVDDFGTGYSSLSSLTTLPFQYLKIDKSFIDDVERREPGSEAILRGILEIAKALDQTTVLEGVETLEQLQLLKTFGAERIQGYVISKPLRVHDAEMMIGKELYW